jgi:hypothetical protein
MINLIPIVREYYLYFVIWEVFWKVLASWKAAKNNSKILFVAILILNTVGLLPIGYLIYDKYFLKKKKK